MSDITAASRYAGALFSLSKKKEVLETIEKDFLKAADFVANHPEIMHLVSNPTVSIPEKEDFIEKILESLSSELLIQFLKVLIILWVMTSSSLITVSLRI